MFTSCGKVEGIEMLLTSTMFYVLYHGIQTINQYEMRSETMQTRHILGNFSTILFSYDTLKLRDNNM